MSGRSESIRTSEVVDGDPVSRPRGSVVGAVALVEPSREGSETVLCGQWGHGYRPSLTRTVEQLVEGPVVEAGLGRVVAVGGVDDLVHARPQCRGKAHRARLAAGDEHAAVQ